MKNRLKTKLTIGLGLLMAASCGCGKIAQSATPPVVPVRVSTVELMPVGDATSYSASITPNAQIDLTFKSGGYVSSIRQVRSSDGRVRSLDMGDYVKAGTVLASVRASEYQDRIQEAQADLGKAQAAHEQAQLSFERISTLFSQASATKPEYDQAKAQFDETVASIGGAKAELSTAHTQLSDSILRAPCDGSIAKRNIDVGSLVGPSSAAFSLIDTHLVRVSFGVPDTAMQLVHLGQKVQINTEAAGNFEGKVTEIAPSADANSRVYSVEITVANPKGRLKAGMIATLALAKSRPQEVTAIPLAAVLRSSQDPNAFVVMLAQSLPDGYMARARAVQVGEAYGNNIAITGGLESGDRVITTGAGLVHDGDRLQVIP
jgi:multidrug efflux system membrane fusion protein